MTTLVYCPFCERELPKSAFRKGAKLCKRCEAVARRT